MSQTIASDEKNLTGCAAGPAGLEIVFSLAVLFPIRDPLCQHLFRLLFELVESREPLEILCVVARAFDECERISPVGADDLSETRHVSDLRRARIPASRMRQEGSAPLRSSQYSGRKLVR